MKVIKRGIPPDLKTYRITCKVCDSVLEFTRKEAKFVSDQRDGNYLEIKCPVCKEKNTLTI